MFSVLFRINSISSLTRRCISSTVKQMANPSMYASCNKAQRIATLNFMDEFADNLIDIHGKCMDIGCGPGNITKNILLPNLHQNATIIGTDISESMIEYANKKYSVEKRLEFDVLDIQTKNLPAKHISEYNHIFSFNTLHWCNNIRRVFENIYRMLQPNGTMLVFFIASHKVFEIFKTLAVDVRFASYIPDISKYISPYQNSINPRKELKELLQELGFTVIHCSLRETYTSCQITDFITSILSILEFFDAMPYDLQEEFRKDFTYQLQEIGTYKQGRNHEIDIFPQKMLIVFAQKRVM